MSIAEDRGASAVVAGHNRSDAGIFEDARPGFFRRLERLNGGVRIVLPFRRLTDAEVIRRARRLGAPLELTWSCYRDGPRPCRRCSACRGRIESQCNGSGQESSAFHVQAPLSCCRSGASTCPAGVQPHSARMRKAGPPEEIRKTGLCFHEHRAAVRKIL